MYFFVTLSESFTLDPNLQKGEEGEKVITDELARQTARKEIIHTEPRPGRCIECQTLADQTAIVHCENRAGKGRDRS